MEKSVIMDININPREVSPLSLAYIGDAVYEVYIRTYIMKDTNMPVNKLHKAATSYVKAKAQSDIVMALADKLTEEETAVYKRGRNAHSYTSAKNADIVDYRRATGFEALIGYLYLSGEKERLEEIVKMGIEYINNINS